MDPRKLRVAIYFLRFSMASYGARMNLFGAGNGYFRDSLRPQADKKTALDYLNMKEEDMIEFEYHGIEVFKPKYFLCVDHSTESLILCFRGTFNLHEVITDICAEYEPFLGGYAHRGFLRCALWLEDHVLPRLKTYLIRHKSRALYLVGHSLGAAIGSLFCMILNHRHLPELRRLVDQHGRGEGDKFKVHFVGYGCPPCVSKELAESAQDICENFVNENDCVPRLSYGNLMDFRDLAVQAAELLRSKASNDEKFDSLNAKLADLHARDVHPKVYIPGNMFYTYKTSRVRHKKLSRDATLRPTVLLQNVEPPPHRVAEEDDTPHYVCEQSDRNFYNVLLIKPNMLFHHLPNKYETGLRRAHDWL
ncbi:Alpha/Beta hydrolase protein [Zopfochytrium polystomum]|nr:Alpha/Beta hydrolase protein [Zopfochytrium polystomum]